MPLTSRIRQFALKVEGTEGTAESLAAADVAFESEELSPGYTNEMNERNPLRSSLSRVRSLPGIGVGQLAGKVEMVGGGAAATVPACKKMLLACGLLECVVKSVALTGAPTGTYTPGEKITNGSTKIAKFIWLSSTTLYYAVISGTDFVAAETLTGSKSAATSTVHGTPAVTARGYAYKPQDPDSSSSYTAQINNDGKRYLISGARATGSIDIEGAGRLPYFNWTMEGKSVKPADLALFTGVTLPSVLPESFLSAQLAVGGDLLVVDGFSMDLGNTLTRRPSANETTGIKSFRITERKPTIKISPEAELEATKDFFTEYDAGTEFGFFAMVGQTATKRMAICAPAAVWSALPIGDRGGLETYEAVLELNGSESDGDDEYLIAFF